MYLKSVALRGFKSFARKTILEFEPGVTIIVGPNGSGKSNIADAIMWVLGEQSPTSLRGARMEDVIFSGSASQRPVNMAEVALTLDNSNNDFPLDYSEVTISRNVVRGGESEYRLNNTACRLLDIQELLSDAGVGRTLNSVISQGQLDRVLSCRPEERREFLEEAGGLLKYRKRREKAVRRLERMDTELVRINDVIREVRRQLRPLVRQAGKLERYQAAVKELKESRLRLDLAMLRRMRTEWEAHEQLQETRRASLEELDGKLTALGARVRELEEGEEAWRRREASLRNTLYRTVSLHERLRAIYPAWEEKQKLLAASGTAAGARARLSALESSDADLTLRLGNLEGRLEGVRELEAERQAAASALRSELSELAREIGKTEARLEVLSSHAVALGSASPDHLERLKEGAGALAAQKRELEVELSMMQENRGALVERLRDLDSRRAEASAAREENLARQRDVKSEQTKLLATLDILTRLDRGEADPAGAASALLGDDPTGGGLKGMLVANLEVEEPYEAAVLAFLGPWAFGLAAADDSAIKTAIGELKRKRLGQALFLRSTDIAAEKPTAALPGAVRALDVASASEGYTGALAALLDGVYIAEGLDEAFALAEKRPDLVFLTPEGDMVSGGSLVKGGSPEVGSAVSSMTRKRREEMEAELSAKREETEALGLEFAALKTGGEEIESELAEAVAVLEEVSRLVIERSAAVASIDGRLELLDGVSAGDMVAGTTGADGQPEPHESALEEMRGREHALVSELEDAEVSLEEARAAAASAASSLEAVRRELEEGRREAEAIREGLAREAGGPAADRDGEDIPTCKALHGRLLASAKTMRERLLAEIEEGTSKFEGAAGSVRAMRDEMATLRESHERLLSELHTEDLSRAELKVKVEQLVERIVDEHKMPLEFALKQYPDTDDAEQLRSRVEELTLELEHIGPVNQEAITEKEALDERYRFLREQTDDIEKAKGQLRRLIRDVDREIEEKFAATVEAVNGHFKEIFSELFPNGSAEIRLTDPEDLLTTGVEIMAQPEGKKLRRISLLSGGETSMAAIAFFFALFRVRPSPFYFLDEVEAALDDVNLHRFLDLVRRFKGESQLVLITHQKRSMEIADILYGVSMQDDGVSRVVSQKMAG